MQDMRRNSSASLNSLTQEPEDLLFESRKRVFFINDTEACPDENDDKEDQIMYFYPPEFEFFKKINLMDGIQGFTTYVKEFGLAEPKIIKLEKEKLACKYIGRYTMALSAPPDEPDTSLINQLENSYTAFEFFHGSFERVFKKVGEDRDKFANEMRNIWKRLNPLIKRIDTLNFAFQPIVFTELNRSANRYFIVASQILQTVKHRVGVLSGCILYNRTMVCSHLDNSTTFWIQSLYDIIHPYSSLGEVEYTNQLLPFYLKKDVLTHLRSSARKPVGVKDLQSKISEDFAPDEHGEYAGLYLQVLPKVTMVVVMELGSIYDLDLIQDISETFVPRLKKLEDQLVQNAILDTNAMDFGDGEKFMVYDRVDRSIHEPLQSYNEETEVAFKFGASLLHETYEDLNNEHVSSQILCNSFGVLHSTKCFGRETYLQIPGGEFTIGPELLDMSRLEPTVQERLQNEHQIYLP